MRLPLTRELPKCEGEKSFRFARIYDEWYRFSAFSLLPGFAHLPHQREAQIWKPLLFIIQLHFADDANAGGQGRPPLQNRVIKQSDKLKFAKNNDNPADPQRGENMIRHKVTNIGKPTIDKYQVRLATR